MSKFLEKMKNRYIVLMFKQMDLTQDGERAAVKGYLIDECNYFYWMADSLETDGEVEFIAKESVCLVQPHPVDDIDEEVGFDIDLFDSDDDEGTYH